VQSARARGFTPDAVPIKRKEKEWSRCEHSEVKSIRKEAVGKHAGLFEYQS
jgi:hypothetical protein